MKFALIVSALVSLAISPVLAANDDFYCHDDNPTASQLYKNKDWMGYITPSTVITGLSIPGTHDTCSTLGGAAVQCQSWSVAGQLAAGIRFLDIRVKNYEDELRIHHGIVYLGTNFRTVLADVCSFLKTQFRETVFMRVKKEQSSYNPKKSLVDQIEAHLALHPSCIYRKNMDPRITTLFEVRGKIVILGDYPGGSEQLGLLYSSPLITIADDYKVYDTWLSKENKKKSVSDNIMESILKVQPTTLRLTYMSGSTGVSPELWGLTFNKQIQFYFGNLGIVVFDFPGADAIDHVIKQNVIYQSGQTLSPEWNTLWGGLWGDLTPEVPFRSGYFACGARLRVSGRDEYDPTVANGLEMKVCKRDNWNTSEWVMIEKGNWGEWVGSECPYGSYINGGEVRFQDAQIDGSDTALNGLSINCKNPSTQVYVKKVIHSGFWGDWKGPYTSPNKYVCGARTRHEGKQLPFVDDTGLNGITFKYCSLY